MSEEKKITQDEINTFLGEKLRELEPYLLKEFQDNLVFGNNANLSKE